MEKYGDKLESNGITYYAERYVKPLQTELREARERIEELESVCGASILGCVKPVKCFDCKEQCESYKAIQGEEGGA